MLLSLSELQPPRTASQTQTYQPHRPSKLDPDIEARFEAQDRLYHEVEEQPSPQPAVSEKGVALSLDTPQIYRGGVRTVNTTG